MPPLAARSVSARCAAARSIVNEASLIAESRMLTAGR
jgi:hypothetical protein